MAAAASPPDVRLSLLRLGFEPQRIATALKARPDGKEPFPRAPLHLQNLTNPIKGLLSALSYLLQGFDRLADNPEAFKDPGRVQVTHHSLNCSSPPTLPRPNLLKFLLVKVAVSFVNRSRHPVALWWHPHDDDAEQRCICEYLAPGGTHLESSFPTHMYVQHVCVVVRRLLPDDLSHLSQ